jgi:nicotinamide mononucleotide transporter
MVSDRVDNSSSYPDALIVALSAVAIWLQSLKFVQSWYGWIAVDFIAVPLFASRELGATALLYVVYLTMCFIGLKAWRAEAIRSPRPAATPLSTVNGT